MREMGGGGGLEKNYDISNQNEQAFRFKFCPTQHHLITRGIIKEEGGAR